MAAAATIGGPRKFRPAKRPSEQARPPFVQPALKTEMQVMAEAIGHRVWAIAEGYIPPSSTGNTRQLVSHEAVCILNAGDADADVEITVYFAEREPAGPYAIRVPARRTRHVRF